MSHRGQYGLLLFVFPPHADGHSPGSHQPDQCRLGCVSQALCQINVQELTSQGWKLTRKFIKRSSRLVSAWGDPQQATLLTCPRSDDPWHLDEWYYHKGKSRLFISLFSRLEGSELPWKLALMSPTSRRFVSPSMSVLNTPCTWRFIRLCVFCSSVSLFYLLQSFFFSYLSCMLEFQLFYESVCVCVSLAVWHPVRHVGLCKCVGVLQDM